MTVIDLWKLLNGNSILTIYNSNDHYLCTLTYRDYMKYQRFPDVGRAKDYMDREVICITPSDGELRVDTI